jgi:hypothetical protein
MKERAAFSLSDDVKFTLEERIPRSQRSQFVDQAIAAALLEDAKKRALEAIEDAPATDTKGEDSVEVLRRIRRERAAYVIDRHNPVAQ